VFAFGNTRFGKCGIGEHHNETLQTPTKVKICHSVESVVCSFTHTFFLTKNGELFVCGYLGDCIGMDDSDKMQKDYQIVTPTRVQALEGVFIVQVSACYQHAVAVSREGDVYSWGKMH
jgi:alpha-tubulin suppressor-like RCC1 family protein